MEIIQNETDKTTQISFYILVGLFGFSVLLILYFLGTLIFS